MDDRIKASIGEVKSTAKRDVESIITLKAGIEEVYHPIVKDLVKSITANMHLENLKDIGGEKTKDLKKAGIKSVHHFLEAAPSDIHKTTKEPMHKVHNYLDLAEDIVIKVAKDVYSELKKAEAKEKKNLSKVDTKSLSKKLNLTEQIIAIALSDLIKDKIKK
jgi:hypothetical protein